MSKAMVNEKRAEWAEAAVRTFMRETGSDAETAVSDLLTNIRHLCQQQPAVYGNFEEELERSAEAHRTEVLEDAGTQYNEGLDKLVGGRGVSQLIAWDPSACVGFSAEQVALIKKGFDSALNQVFLLERAGERTPVETKASRILISVKGGVVQEVASDAAARVYVLDRDTDGCDMVSIVDGEVVDIQQPDVVTEPEKLARMWGQATEGELVSVHDLDDIEFEIDTSFDMSGNATHEGPFFTAGFTISRNEPDTSDDDRRSICTLNTEITASDGRQYKSEEEITVADGGIRNELEEIVSSLDTKDALESFLDDKIRALNFSKKPSGRSMGM